MEREQELSNFVGNLIKIVFRDGNEIKVKRGRLVAVHPQFLEIRTQSNEYLINKSDVSKIQKNLGAGK